MTSPDRTLFVFSLFTLEHPVRTVEEAAAMLGVSRSSAHRYFAALTEAGFLIPESAGRYILGPAFLQYDRLIQLTDPLVTVANPIMGELVACAPEGTTVVLCRLFRDSVLCVHQVPGRGPRPAVSYERGRPMPLFRGATSKIILAHLPARHLRQLHTTCASDIADAGLGDDWQAFRDNLAALRRTGHATSSIEVDPGSLGIAAPILDGGRKALGSVSFVIAGAEQNDSHISRLTDLLMGAAREIEEKLRRQQSEQTMFSQRGGNSVWP